MALSGELWVGGGHDQYYSNESAFHKARIYVINEHLFYNLFALSSTNSLLAIT